MDALSLFHMVLTKPFHACRVLLLPHTVSPSKSPDQIQKEGKWAVPLNRMSGKAMFQRECYLARNVATVPLSHSCHTRGCHSSPTTKASQGCDAQSTASTLQARESPTFEEFSRLF